MTPRFPSILAFVVGALLLAGAAEQAAARVAFELLTAES
jgi:hypothetical protein